jgi:DNA primase large subunit
MRSVTPEMMRAKLDPLLKQQELDGSNARLDEASHFILRLSYSQNEDLRRWFLQQESALFYHRLLHLSKEQLATSVQRLMDICPIPKAEQDALQHDLMQFVTIREFATASFYKVPFHQALDLVAKRDVYLRHGYAYVAQSKVVSILVAKFRTRLSRGLAALAPSSTAWKSSEHPEAHRVAPLLTHFHTSAAAAQDGAGGADHDVNGRIALTANTIPDLVSHMPLCMRQLHTGLKQDKHLKHWGRLQYGLFLKGAGLSMDEAMAFFQRHFGSVGSDDFTKKYAYNIRHMYGKEGKRADYTPYACTKIILGNAPSSTGDHHGCPYKHYDDQHLASLLQQLKIGHTPEDRMEILRLKKDGQIQLACQKHFSVQHANITNGGNNGGGGGSSVSLDNVGNHPNAWFRASVALSEYELQATLPQIAAATATGGAPNSDNANKVADGEDMQVDDDDESIDNNGDGSAHVSP